MEEESRVTLQERDRYRVNCRRHEKKIEMQEKKRRKEEREYIYSEKTYKSRKVHRRKMW